jgi:isopenicillin-N epimerase
VTSPTALVFPIERIISTLEPEIPVLVDGAHAPGMLPLDLAGLGASYYAGNLHKWVCAPKGAGFVVVADHLRDSVRPTVISHGWNTSRDTRSKFHQLFDWTGTFDPSAWLAVPDSLAFMSQLDADGWEGVMAANRQLALAARDLLAGRLGIEPPVPDSMIGSMAALPLDGARPGLAERLRRKGIVAAIPPWPSSDRFLLRVSAQRYNSIDEYERLADAVVAD